jgi:hypothetical protein
MFVRPEAFVVAIVNKTSSAISCVFWLKGVWWADRLNHWDKCKEHMGHICLGQPEKSGALENRVGTGQNIEFSGTAVLLTS